MSENGNDKTGIGKIISGGKLDWPTLVLILVTGGGNLVLSERNKGSLSYEQQEALTKIRELHKTMDDFEDSMRANLNNQAQILNGQTQILDDHKELLQTIQQNQEKFKKQSFGSNITP